MKDDLQNNTKAETDVETSEDDVRDGEVIEEFVPEDEDGNPAILIKKLRDRIKKLEAEKQEYLTGWQRARADYSNYKKQVEEEKMKMISYANKNLVEEVLPVMESFDQAMGNKTAWEQVPANWRVGVEYIAQQLKTILESHGVTEINPVGQVFDLTRHEAVSHISIDKLEDNNKIVSVVKKGYLYKDSVLVPARVNVGEYKTKE